MKKIFLMLVIMLFSFASVGFAENWMSCDSPWQFDSDSIRNVSSNVMQIQVNVRQFNGNSLVAEGVVEFHPLGSDPYKFVGISGYRYAKDGITLRRIGTFKDFNLSNAICALANIR